MATVFRASMSPKNGARGAFANTDSVFLCVHKWQFKDISCY